MGHGLSPTTGEPCKQASRLHAAAQLSCLGIAQAACLAIGYAAINAAQTTKLDCRYDPNDIYTTPLDLASDNPGGYSADPEYCNR